MLSLRFFGEMEASRDGAALSLPSSKKARALLAYLAVTGRAQSRSRLCSLLWELPDDPRGALRWSLSKLRGVVNETEIERIHANRDLVAFDPKGAEIDVAEVKALVARGFDRLDLEDLKRLAELQRGEFLEGLNMTNCHEFFTWHVAEQESFRQLRLKTLETLITRLGPDVEAALPYSRALVQADPYSVEARLKLVRALKSTGHETEAERHEAAGRRILSEIGEGEVAAFDAGLKGEASAPVRSPVRSAAPPRQASPEGTPLGDAYASTLESYAAGRHPGKPIAPPPELTRDTSTPLVGRKKTLGAISTNYDRVRSTMRANGFLVLAEPGMGKTRLIAEFEKRLLDEEQVLISASCHENERTRAYGIWIDALRRMGAGENENSPYRPMLDLMTKSGDGSTNDPHLETLYAEITGLIASWDGVGPICLSIDDLQWIDEASAKLLTFIAREHRNRPVYLLMAAREGELPDNIAAAAFLRELRREIDVSEAHLGPLTENEQQDLVRALNPRADAARISDMADGNLFLMTELARLDDGSDGDVTASVHGLIESHMAMLSPLAVTVMNWNAVVGTAMTIRQFAFFMGTDELDIADALDVLVRKAIFREQPSHSGGNSRYAFRHDIYRGAIYGAISSPRRQVMHLKVARGLDEFYGTDEMVASRVAFHAIRGGNAELAAAACIRAGRRCLRLFANNDAYALAERALTYADKMTDAERVKAKIEAHEIRYFARKIYHRAGFDSEIEQLAEDALALGLHDYAHRAYQLESMMRWETGDLKLAHRDTQRAAIAARGSEPKQQIIALAEAARCLALLERDLTEAESLALEAAALAKQDGFRPFTIPLAQGMLRAFQGQADQAAQHYEEALDLAEQSADWLGKFHTLEQAIALELQYGDVEKAAAYAETLCEVGDKFREGSEAPFARALSAVLKCAQGQENACQLVDDALGDLRLADAKLRLAFVQCRTARYNLAGGQYEMAATRAREALDCALVMGRKTEIALARAVLADAFGALGKEAAREEQLKELASLPEAELSDFAQRERTRVMQSQAVQ